MQQVLQKAKRVCLIVMALCITTAAVFAQSIAVKGKVANDKGEALANTTIVVKGTNNGTTTNDAGEFSINVPGTKSVLVITAVGHQSQEITVGNQTNINVTLLSGEASQLESVVVVGYATQKKVTVTGAVAQVKGSELQKSPAVNLSNSLAGRLPGITAINSSGEPGYDGSTIRIRGTNTLGNSSALIVIDGVPERAGGFDRLNPADIESMSILKDASAAIYGARAANGVILITTKQGKTGKPRLSYDFNQGWAQPTVIPKMSNVLEYGEIRNQNQVFDNVAPANWAAAWQAIQTTGTYINPDNGNEVKAALGFMPEEMEKYRNKSDPWGYPDTDWFDAVLKKWSPQQRHNLQLNGGTENVKYLLSVGHQNQEGYYKNSATGYKQYDMRFNLDAKINKYLRANIGVSAREEDRFFPIRSAGAIFRMLMRGKPQENAIWPNGLPGRDIEFGDNPVTITTNATGYDKDKRDYFQSNGRIEFDIPGVEGLKLSGIASLDKSYRNVKRWETPWYLYSWDKSTYEADGVTPLLIRELRSNFQDPRLNQLNETVLNILLGAMLNYDKSFGDHTFNFLAAVNRESIRADNFSAYRRFFISSAIDQMFAGGDRERNNGGGAYERARLSYFGRLGYNFKEKYLAEFLWRYDGSYMFAPDQRWGFFPSISAGWRISEEDFFRNNVSFIDNLKLRASYGRMGNDQVYYNDVLQEFHYMSTYGFDRSYIIDDQVMKAIYERRVPNPGFTWEVANNMDIGLEGSLLNNKLSFEVDYFVNKREKILIQRLGSTPGSSGIRSLLPPVNEGKIENRGFDFRVGYNGSIGDLTYSVSVNGGYAKNKIVFWDEGNVPEWQRSTGKPFGTNGAAFLAYQYDGVFVDQKDIDANAIDYSGAGGTNLRPGDMKLKDINDDKVINGDDMVRLDKTRDPRFTGGFSINLQYKNFDLSLLFQGATGGLLFIGTESGDIGNYLKYSYDNRWSIDNPSSEHPRLANRNNTYYTNGGQAGNNTYWLRNSNYLRMKNLEIGYNLPADIGKRLGMSNFRVYVNGLNLITWDELGIFDPESTSSSGQYYPQARIINVGARVTF
ncbi:MAG: TonB-dependent receptor [Terrimonas sp.]|nr:TonB-dependent receptor [Terrimonas sp.]